MSQPQPTLPTTRAFAEKNMKTTTATRTQDGNAAQRHLTLAFPMQSPADCAAVRNQRPALVANLYRAADASGDCPLFPLMSNAHLTMHTPQERKTNHEPCITRRTPHA